MGKLAILLFLVVCVGAIAGSFIPDIMRSSAQTNTHQEVKP